MGVGLRWFLNRVFGSRYWFVGLCVLLVSAGVAYASVSVPVGVTYPDLTPTDAQPWIVEVPFFDYSYGVFEFSNGTVYAVNGSNGDKFVAGTVVTVVQACLDAMVNGGRLFVGDMVEDCTDGDSDGDIFDVEYDGIEVLGSGWGKLDGSGGEGTTFNYWNDVVLFNVSAVDGSLLEGLRFSDFRVTYGGASPVNPCLWLRDVSYSFFDGLCFSMGGAGATVIKLEAVNSYCCQNVFDGVIVKGSAGGVCVDLQAAGGTWVNINHFRDCHFWNTAVCVILGNNSAGDTDFNVFEGCIYDTSTEISVLDNGTGNTFVGGCFMDVSTGYTYYQDAGAIYAVVSGISAIGAGDGYVNVTSVYGDMYVGSLPPN